MATLLLVVPAHLNVAAELKALPAVLTITPLGPTQGAWRNPEGGIDLDDGFAYRLRVTDVAQVKAWRDDIGHRTGHELFLVSTHGHNRSNAVLNVYAEGTVTTAELLHRFGGFTRLTSQGQYVVAAAFADPRAGSNFNIFSICGCGVPQVEPVHV